MNVHDALARRRRAESVLRKLYRSYAREYQVMPTVVVSKDFSQYVAAMAEQWPEQDRISWPSMEQARWPFKDQSVLFIFEEPIYIEFLVTTEGAGDDYRALDLPIHDEQPVLAMFVLDNRLTHFTVAGPHGETTLRPPHPSDQAQHTVFIHSDPVDIATDGRFAWSLNLTRHPREERMGYCARWERSFTEAVGHHMASLEKPVFASRSERRAVERTEVPYRLLRLRTPGRAVEKTDVHKTVAWTKRWGVRGHWRDQPFGPRQDPQYRRIWIDPYIKGPDDMPLDLRPTVFKLEGKRGVLE